VYCIPPEPEITWDSLRARLTYYDLASDCAINAIYFVSLSFDSIGTITRFNIGNVINESANLTKNADKDTVYLLSPSAIKESFNAGVIADIEKQCRATKWRPAIVMDRPAPWSITFPVYFHAKTANDPGVLLRDEPPPKRQIGH
jgi:hypothetical protein